MYEQKATELVFHWKKILSYQTMFTV